MSQSAGRRKTAQRLFAAEFADSTHSYAESDDDRAPNYVVAPSGLRMNRLFVAGVVTEIAPAGESMLRARIADPTGAFVCYAGQYQPDALATLESLDPPAFVAVTGKARTFSPDDADVVYSSIRPEVITEIDASTRDRWNVRTARRTLERIATTHDVETLGVDVPDDELRRRLEAAGLATDRAAGIVRARSAYGTTTAYLSELQRLAIGVLELVADQTETVEPLSYPPGEAASVSFVPALDRSIGLDGESTAGGATGSTTARSPAVEGEADPTSAPADAPIDDDQSSLTDETPDPVDETEPEAVSTDDTAPADAADERTKPNAAATDDEFDPEAFDPDEFELDEEVREQVESEFGTEFSTGNEVETEEAAPETDDDAESSPADTAAESDESTTDSSDEPSTATSGETDTDSSDETSAAGESGEESAEASAVDLSAVLLSEMRTLNDGDGVDRTELIATVHEEVDVSEQAIAEAIQEALMNGQCYEPAEDTLKPI